MLSALSPFVFLLLVEARLECGRIPFYRERKPARRGRILRQPRPRRCNRRPLTLIMRELAESPLEMGELSG